MHIPDSAISPATALVTGAAMLPVWWASSRRLRDTLPTRQVPLLAIGAAFSFTVMMFNIPFPGGTSVHPIGAVLLAVLLGPWAAILGVTVTLALQALFFADGGVLAIGANSFAMAFAMPVTGYAVYRLLAGRADRKHPRHALAAGVGAYVGLNIAALLVAILLGIQPAMHHAPDGRALYFPFGLSVTVPAIMLAHLTLAGFAEAVVTTLAVRYAQTAGVSLYATRQRQTQATPERRKNVWLWAALGGMAALSPLGLLATGDAWGEWSVEDLAERAGYLPERLATMDEKGWKGLNWLPDYLGDRGAGFYILAALAGIALASGVIYLLMRLLIRPSAQTVAPMTSDLQPGQIPSWLLSANSEALAENVISKSKVQNPKSQGFLAKTLGELTAAAHQTLVAERWTRQDGLLQKLDARTKIVGLIGYVALLSFLHHWLALGALTVLVLALATLSRLPMRVFGKRIVAAALFVGGVTLPAALNLVTPGEPLLVLLRDPHLAITKPGLAVAGVLTLRVCLAVSFVTLLTLTTPWNALLTGLRALFVPRPFLVILAMTYRYLTVLMQAAEEMFIARQSRSVGRLTSGANRRFIGSAMGGLFDKSLALTDEVHAAMVSRGWNGTPRTLTPLRWERADFVWLATMTLLAVILIGGQGLG